MSFKEWWSCRVMGWHLKPRCISQDEVNSKGLCPLCGTPVMLDSQGNWFGAGSVNR